MAQVDVTGNVLNPPLRPPPPQVSLTPPPQVSLTPMPEAADLPPGTAGGISRTAVVDRIALMQQLRDLYLRAQEAFARPAQAVARYTALGQLNEVNVADYGYDPLDSRTWAAAEQAAGQEAIRRQAQGINATVTYPQGTFTPGRLLTAAGNVLTTELPGMGRVADIAGRAGEEYGRRVLPQFAGPVGTALEQLAPSPLKPSTIGAAAGRFVGEALIPTQVWMAALELVPGIGTVPDLMRAVREGAPEAVSAVARAGDRLGAGETVQRGLKALGSEAGMAKIPGELPSGGEPQSAFERYMADIQGRSGELKEAPQGGGLGNLGAMSDRELTDALRTTEARLSTADQLFEAAREGGLQAGDIDYDNALNLKQLMAGEHDRLAAEIMGRRLGIRQAPGQASMLGSEKAIGSEAGMAKKPQFGWKATAPSPNAEAIANLQAQRAQITKALRSLTKGEQSRVTVGSVADVMRVAGRYGADSEQRQALIDLVRPKIANLPEVDQKFIVASIETMPTKADRTAATLAQRTRQASGALQAFEQTPGTAQEKAIASFKAMGGKQAQQFVPLGGKFNDQETADLFQRITDAAESGKLGRVFDRDNAISALTLLLTGERLPGVRSEALKPLNLSPGEIKLLGQAFGPEFEAAIPRTAQHMTNFQRFIDILNLPRALVTAVDFSAAGRQGIVLAARNPAEWAKSFVPMIKAMGSEEGFARAAQNLRNNAKYEDALLSGIDLTTPGGGALAEEPFISTIASKFPLVRASERGYIMYLDTLRMLTYEKYANRLEKLAAKQGWDVRRVSEVKGNLARFINHATGRGDLGFLGNYAPAMNALFFSPRFFVSRPQSVWDMVRPGADSFTRQVAFENLGAFVGAGVGLLEAARLMGADVEVDPRSSDFGKMRFGNTRIDFWGGYQPIARYIAQFATASNKELFTGQTKYAYPGTTALRFFRSKLSPAGSMIYDYTVGKGKSYNGDDLFFSKPGWQSAWTDFAQRIIPLSIQDAIAGYRSGGPAAAAAASLASSVGGGVSSFEPSETQQQTLQQSKLSRQLKDAGFPDLNADFDANPSVRALVAKTLGLSSQDVQGKSLTELRAAQIEQYAPVIRDRDNVPLAEARRRIGNAFDKKLSDLRQRERDAQLRFWKANPDLLRQALDAGLTSPSQEKVDILKGR